MTTLRRFVRSATSVRSNRCHEKRGQLHRCFQLTDLESRRPRNLRLKISDFWSGKSDQNFNPRTLFLWKISPSSPDTICGSSSLTGPPYVEENHGLNHQDYL